MAPVIYGFMSESPDGVDPSTKMFLEDEPTDTEAVVRDFIDYAADRLGITQLPQIELHTDPEWSSKSHSFGRYTPETHTLEVSLVNRHVMDILRTTAHELAHCRQNQDQALPDEAGETGSDWENQAHAVAGVIMRDWADRNPTMFESSGYIPTKAERNDPRFLMALTKDVQPGATGLNANRMRLKTDAQGRPQLLRANGRVNMAESQLGTVLQWPEVVDKVNSAMKATGWKGRRMADGAFMYSTKGQETDDQWYIAVIDNAGQGYFKYTLGTIEDGDPHIDDAFTGTLPNTLASISELMNEIREGFGLNEQGVAEGSDSNLSYQGNCTEDDVIEHIFGDVNNFANMVEEHGDEFTVGDLVVKYDPETDVHSFYYKKQGVAEGKQPGKPVVDAILKVIPVAQEIWFHGSRATGSHRKNSDTDILVIVPDDLVGDQYLAVVRTLQKLSSIFDNYDIQPTKSGTNIHRIAQEEGQLLWANKQGLAENFADGRNPQDKGDSKRHGINTKASVSSLRKTAKSGGRKGQLAHWLANMKSGRARAKRKNESLDEVRINNSSGVGAVPYNADVDYFGLQVQMRPSMFLKLALPMDPHDPEERKAIAFCKGELNERGIGAPFLNVSVPEAWEQGDFSLEARVKGHDGRHRCHAILEKEGDDAIEMHIFIAQTRRRDITDEMIENLRNGILNQLGQFVRGPIFGEAK
jgi:predicted nucleotidyltransferase